MTYVEGDVHHPGGVIVTASQAHGWVDRRGYHRLYGVENAGCLLNVIAAASKAFITKFQRDERWLQDSDAGLIVHDAIERCSTRVLRPRFQAPHQLFAPPDGGSLLDRVHIIRLNANRATPALLFSSLT